MRTYWMALMTATALMSSAALAQTSPAENGIPILSGGVGSSDRAQIEAQQSSYGLKIVFSGKGGAFLSGVHVALADKSGATVLSTVTDGPILLATPPAGTYKLTATANGIEKTQNVIVGKTLKTYQIVFPISDDPELTTPDGTYLPKAASSMDGFAAPVPSGTTYAPAPVNTYAPAPVGE